MSKESTYFTATLPKASPGVESTRCSSLQDDGPPQAEFFGRTHMPVLAAIHKKKCPAGAAVRVKLWGGIGILRLPVQGIGQIRGGLGLLDAVVTHVSTSLQVHLWRHIRRHFSLPSFSSLSLFLFSLLLFSWSLRPIH